MCRRLAGHGFEHVVVGCSEEKLLVEYENRCYRSQTTGIGVVLALVSEECPDVRFIVLILKRRNIPLVRVACSREDYRKLLAGTISLSGFAQRIEVSRIVGSLDGYRTSEENRSYFKVDAVVAPQVKALFGRAGDWARIQINAIPEVSMPLAKGLVLTTQVILPLENEFGAFDQSGDYIRPGRTLVSKVFRFPSTFFLWGSVGYFDLERYGFSADGLWTTNDGRLSLEGRVGLTGFQAYQGDWKHSDLSDWTYLLRSKYQWTSVDLSLTGTAGRFLYGDVGGRLDLVRTFGEVSLGFFGIRTTANRSGKLIGGFSIRIPVYPPRRRAPGRFRFGAPLSFPWAYRYRGESSGFILSDRYSLMGWLEDTAPSYIRNHVLDIKKAVRWIENKQ
ncbi:MAG: YjbH domain-containing protein [Candidatus Latescibacteria bacterium]|nr:YjbH domain-containing protein [Candidatus Latescibacterota bacterium]